MQENLTRREQNQRDTWNAIHLSAYQLVSELSLAAATVDDIASRAGISRRTFFNYFPTKEDAILGTRLPEVPHGTAERYAESGQDELTRVVHLFVAVLRTAVPEETSLRRRQMVGQHPGLRSRVMQLVTDVEHLVREVVESAAAQQHAQKPDDAAAALEARFHALPASRIG